MTGYKDLFSAQAAVYARARPHYPAELFAYLATLPTRDALAWDCATGNGQAATGLVNHFDRVMATDASPQQIAHARHHDRISYRVALAERSELPDQCVDLITVAQAFHWFDPKRFAAEVQRVLRPGGVLAIWSYRRALISPDIDPITDRYSQRTLRRYWQPEHDRMDDNYARLSLPVPELADVPELYMEQAWTLNDLLAYLFSWSSSQRYYATTGINPVARVQSEYEAVWGDPHQTRTVRWRLWVRIGRKA